MNCVFCNVLHQQKVLETLAEEREEQPAGVAPPRVNTFMVHGHQQPVLYEHKPLVILHFYLCILNFSRVKTVLSHRQEDMLVSLNTECF